MAGLKQDVECKQNSTGKRHQSVEPVNFIASKFQNGKWLSGCESRFHAFWRHRPPHHYFEVNGTLPHEWSLLLNTKLPIPNEWNASSADHKPADNVGLWGTQEGTPQQRPLTCNNRVVFFSSSYSCYACVSTHVTGIVIGVKCFEDINKYHQELIAVQAITCKFQQHANCICVRAAMRFLGRPIQLSIHTVVWASPRIALPLAHKCNQHAAKFLSKLPFFVLCWLAGPGPRVLPCCRA